MSAHGQYSVMSSAGPRPIAPVVLIRRRTPMTIQAIGQVKAQIPDRSKRPRMIAETTPATPTRMTNSGHASPHERSAARWTRKISPRPMSHVAAISDPLRVLVTNGASACLASAYRRPTGHGRGPPDRSEGPLFLNAVVRDARSADLAAAFTAATAFAASQVTLNTFDLALTSLYPSSRIAIQGGLVMTSREEEPPSFVEYRPTSRSLTSRPGQRKPGDRRSMRRHRRPGR